MTTTLVSASRKTFDFSIKLLPFRQFDFKFVDTAYNLTTANNYGNVPLTVTLQNDTFEAALFPSKIHFIPDGDPPTAEAKVFVFTHPRLVEGLYNLTISEWVWSGPFSNPAWFSRLKVPVVFSFDSTAREREPASHEEL